MKLYLCTVALCLAAAYVTAKEDGEVAKKIAVPVSEADENDQVFLLNVVEHEDAKSEESHSRNRRSVTADLDLLTPARKLQDLLTPARKLQDLLTPARKLLGLRQSDEFRPYAASRDSFYGAVRRPSLQRRPEGVADPSSYGLLSASSLTRSGLLRAPAPALPAPLDPYRYYYYAPGSRPALVATAAADGYYYGAGYPATADYGAGYPATADSALAGSGYSISEEGVTEWSFLNFYNSFRPLQAVKTDDNVFVRNYFRYGSFDDCLSDFWRLQPTEVRSLDTAALLADRDYRLLSGVAAGASGYLINLPRQAAVGLAGLMRDYPYRVVALRSGCQLDDFPGYHDCIIFSGATDPYTSTVRRFVYVQDQQQQKLTAISGGYNVPAVLRPAQLYQPGRLRGPVATRPVDAALTLE